MWPIAIRKPATLALRSGRRSTRIPAEALHLPDRAVAYAINREERHIHLADEPRQKRGALLYGAVMGQKRAAEPDR